MKRVVSLDAVGDVAAAQQSATRADDLPPEHPSKLVALFNQIISDDLVDHLVAAVNKNSTRKVGARGPLPLSTTRVEMRAATLTDWYDQLSLVGGAVPGATRASRTLQDR